MNKNQEKFISTLNNLKDDSCPKNELLLWENKNNKLSCFYAPFDYVNTKANLVLIGITPGKTQMNRSLNAASNALKNGSNIEESLERVKKEGSFSGLMRNNLVNTLNKLGFNKKYNVNCCSEFWSMNNKTVHFCSLFKQSIFINGKDYNGSPDPLTTTSLRQSLMNEFVQELQAIPKSAELVPLGEKVSRVLNFIDNKGLIKQRITKVNEKIIAPPHPSGANAESISLLLEEVYPTRDAYAEFKYREYLNKRSWEKRKNGKPQPESKYKNTRYKRWESMLDVRKFYGLSV